MHGHQRATAERKKPDSKHLAMGIAADPKGFDSSRMVQDGRIWWVKEYHGHQGMED